MNKITTDMVKDLRSKTGAGVMDCHAALAKHEGDLEAAEKFIRSDQRAQAIEIRPCGVGVVHSYVHTGGRIGVMVEVECGTDFAARTDEFQTFIHDLAMHVAALKPTWISPEDVSWDASEDEEVDSSRYLILQPFIKDGSKSISDLLAELSARIGEPVAIRRFVRWEVGEEISTEMTQPLDKPRGPIGVPVTPTTGTDALALELLAHRAVATAVVILLALAATFSLMLCV